VVIEPWRFAADGPAGFAGDGVVVSAVALGPWEAAEVEWWRKWQDASAISGGAGRLRSGGVTFRALCSDLGIATALVGEVAAAARR
jgi:hypothetical protein